jgi:hypothetical protein
MHAAVGQQDFGFTDAAGIEDDLAGRRIASSKRAWNLNSPAWTISWLIKIFSLGALGRGEQHPLQPKPAEARTIPAGGPG